MKLIGLMLVRNEGWVLGMTARAALRWVDSLLIFMDRCSDNTDRIVHSLLQEYGPNRIAFQHTQQEEHWREMDIRQQMLLDGRGMGGTHFAMIDGDEAITHNQLRNAREWTERLTPRQVLDMPMICPHRGLENYRDDHTEWSRSQLSVSFCDAPDLSWKPRNGYHFHQRCPQGSTGHINPLHKDKSNGGAFHFQWVSWERLISKHRWYALNERIRWPEKRSIDEINRIYSMSSDELGLQTKPIPKSWYGDYEMHFVYPEHKPWYDTESRRMIDTAAPGSLDGLNLFGWKA